jgi:hypothetical protein
MKALASCPPLILSVQGLARVFASEVILADAALGSWR